MIMIPTVTSNEDTLSELRESCSSTISANMTTTHKFPISGRRNSFINDSDQWDFFDNDDDYDDCDEFAADTDDAFKTIHPKKQVVETHTETKKDRKEEETQEVDLNSRKNRKQLVASAVNIVLSSSEHEKSGQKTTKSPVPTNRRNRRRLGDHFMTSSSHLSLSSSNHSRRSASSSSRKSGVVNQDSKLVASQLRAQQKHERSKRPSGARGRRRAVSTGSVKSSRSSSLQPGGRDNLDSSEHSTATNATIKAHNAYAKTRGSISTTSQSPSSKSVCRKRLDLLRNSDGPNMTKLVPPLTLETDIEIKEDVPSLPVGEKSSKTKLSTYMAVQKRLDGKRCTVKRQQNKQQKKDSRDRKLDINASLDKYLSQH